MRKEVGRKRARQAGYPADGDLAESRVWQQ
jgi:hypothetical protein